MEKKREPATSKPEKKGLSRRRFVKGAATIAAVSATIPLKPMLGGSGSVVEASTIDYEPNKRTNVKRRHDHSTIAINKAGK